MQVSLTPPASLTEEQIARWSTWVDVAPMRRNPCIRPEFALAVSRARPSSRVLVISDRTRDVAYMPLDVRRNRGWPIGREINDGNGLVVRPGVGLDIAAAVRLSGLWSVHWEHRDDLPDPLARHDLERREAARVCLDGGTDRWEVAARSVIRELDRKRRKLEREVGPVTFELVADMPPAEAADLVAGHKALQEADRGRSAGDPPRSAALMREVLALPTGGRLAGVVSVLRAAGRPMATSFGLHDGRMFVLTTPTVDPAFATWSPGGILHVELLRQVTGLGVSEVDLGVGINQTKRRLATHLVTVGAGRVFGGVVGKRLWDVKETARPVVKDLLGRLAG